MAARTGGLKGIVSVHTWLVLKHAGAAAYDRYDVVGWGDPVRRNSRPADGRWYSNAPLVIYELKGDEAERLLPKVEAAIRALSMVGARQLPHLARPELQHLCRHSARRRAGARRPTCRRPPSAATIRPAAG